MKLRGSCTGWAKKWTRFHQLRRERSAEINGTICLTPRKFKIRQLRHSDQMNGFRPINTKSHSLSSGILAESKLPFTLRKTYKRGRWIRSSQKERKGEEWNRKQTEWNIVHILSSFYLQKPVYGSMPLEPAETRAKSNLLESRVSFSRYNQHS